MTLMKRVENTLNIKFSKGNATAKSVEFKGNKERVMMYSTTYHNVYAKVTDDTSSRAIKRIANKIRTISEYGKLVQDKLSTRHFTFYGALFIVETGVITTVRVGIAFDEYKEGDIIKIKYNDATAKIIIRGVEETNTKKNPPMKRKIKGELK